MSFHTIVSRHGSGSSRVSIFYRPHEVLCRTHLGPHPNDRNRTFWRRCEKNVFIRIILIGTGLSFNSLKKRSSVQQSMFEMLTLEIELHNVLYVLMNQNYSNNIQKYSPTHALWNIVFSSFLSKKIFLPTIQIQTSFSSK